MWLSRPLLLQPPNNYFTNWTFVENISVRYRITSHFRGNFFCLTRGFVPLNVFCLAASLNPVLTHCLTAYFVNYRCNEIFCGGENKSTDYKLGNEGSCPNSSTNGNMILADNNLYVHFHLQMWKWPYTNSQDQFQNFINR